MSTQLPKLKECEHVRGKVVGLVGVSFELAVHNPPGAPILIRCCSLSGCVLRLVAEVLALCPDAERELRTLVAQAMADELRAHFAAQQNDGGDRDR